MTALFSIDSKGRVVIDPAAYGIKVYRKIWDRHKDKDKSIDELSYIYYMSDYKSFVSDITDEQDKHDEVVKMIFNGEKSDFKPDDVIKDAIELYKKDLPISVKVLEDAKVGINTLRKYFREVDLTDLDPKTGKPIHDANKFNNNLKSLGTLIENVKKLEEHVRRDTSLESTVRGGRQKGMFEDPEDFT